MGCFFLGLTLVFAWLAYGLNLQNHWVPFAFLTGGLFSGLAGFFGMKTAPHASSRVAHAASQSLDARLRLAFRSGAVRGLVVVGLALLDISVWFLVLTKYVTDADPPHKLLITTTMLTFGMGASLQALFARVGGGIFTKAANVGADLVGKVEAGIPEDDPRNPATIADNVSDNVGDVAGMGADLYESYVGSILATQSDPEVAYKAVIAPMLVAAVGTLLSIIGIFAVRVTRGASQRDLLNALGRGVNLIFVASFLILRALELPNFVGILGAIVVGLITGIVIGKATEYYTSQEYKPTQSIGAQAETGPATVIISGLGVGMMSTVIPVLAIVIGTTIAYCLATGSWSFTPESIPMGLYGIGIAAVGMLSTLGLTLATDAYGPIADNAGGNAEMAGLGPEVRRPRLVGQYHRRHRQGLRHRLRRPHGPRTARVLRRGAQDRHASPSPGLDRPALG
ncbi:MAG: sodium/proton-translocating pyrophosphatase [Candidatus Synoicihabitans palmerolidicus]|nr:sodium/proton-translocating pyrophosphatase [Candidatus Synoicihabitans palmerolidicus]